MSYFTAYAQWVSAMNWPEYLLVCIFLPFLVGLAASTWWNR